MDKETRTRIQRATQAARRLLEDEFSEQLGGVYDIRLDGTIAAEPGDHLRDDPGALRVRAKLITAVQHHRDQGTRAADAVAALLRECAFTTLNRFVALKMLEARGIVQECVSNGAQSSGFREFSGLAPGLSALSDQGYRLYIDSLFDEIGCEVRVLFDRRDPASLLWPRRPALDALLDTLNASELAAVWGEDETIGWVYQYFNGDDERKAMRAASQAPRNSRELAVRNQFFTPRYVVEFLTDNTLARTWVEMRQGDTRLVDDCRYLVKRRGEVFLQSVADDAPSWLQAAAKGDWSELPEQVDFDDINAFAHLIDGYRLAVALGYTSDANPAGLGAHVSEVRGRAAGLESADLLDFWLLLFYEVRAARHGGFPPEGEALEELKGVFTALRTGLKRLDEIEPADRPVFVPFRLKKDPRDLKILDPACGSGHFLLYSFDVLLPIYEEAWADTHSSPSDITGKRLLEDYPELTALHHALPGLILRHNLHGVDIDPRAAQIAALALWMRAQRAWDELSFRRADRPLVTRSNIVVAEPMPGETDLLNELCAANLDKGIADIVRAVFKDMKLAGEAGTLLRIEATVRRGTQKLSSRGVLFAAQDSARWAQVEMQVYQALRRYANQVGAAGFRRRLFAEDAARGFAFVESCSTAYDVVLMNPPFGEPVRASKSYLFTHFASAKADLGAAFVEALVSRVVQSGFIGVLKSRAVMYHDLLEPWRKGVLFGEQGTLHVLADLGYGVLDAVVEVDASVVGKRPVPEADFLCLLGSTNKSEDLGESIAQLTVSGASPIAVRRSLSDLMEAPLAKLLYDVGPHWLRLFRGPVGHPKYTCRAGIASGDDFRYVRTLWEVAPNRRRDGVWWSFAKGGPYGKYRSNIHLLARTDLFQFYRRPGDTSLYGPSGVTYSERTTSNMSVRAMPANTIFSYAGPAAIPTPDVSPALLLGFLNSSAVTMLIEAVVGGGDYASRGTAARHFYPSYLERLPAIEFCVSSASKIEHAVRSIIAALRFMDAEETDLDFLCPTFLSGEPTDSFADLVASWGQQCWALLQIAYQKVEEIEKVVNSRLGLTEADVRQAYPVTGYPFANGVASECPVGISLFGKPNETLGPKESSSGELGLVGSHRFLMKLSHYLCRTLETMAHLRAESPESVASVAARSWEPTPTDIHTAIERALSYLVGVAMGRFNVQLVGRQAADEDGFDPFAELAPCPPSILAGSDGLPVSEAPVEYPVLFPPDGILVDDPGAGRDLLLCVQQSFGAVFGDDGDDRLNEAREVLAPKAPDLRRWLQSRFFELHIKRYSKSRRKAPIYWQLGTPSASYSVWLYNHRMGPDTLHTVLRDHVGPKLRFETDRLAALRAEAGDSPAPSQRKDIETQESFVDELRAFRDEIQRIAPLWNPDLDDGVVINASFLHRLFAHTRAWQKECEKKWKKLKAGDYDWAHLAMRLWPERVVPKCADDRSFAIAHGLEDVFWYEDEDGKWKPREVDEATVAQHVQQKTIPAVKEALRQVAAAPPERPARRRARRAPTRTRATPAPTPPTTQLSLDLPSPTPDRTAASQDALRAALGRFPEGARKADLVTASEIDAKDWKKAIDALVAAGEVVRQGHGRGTRYTLAGSG